MAPRPGKELLSVIVDVSPTMHADLPVISAALTEFVHKKLLFGKADNAQLELQLSGSNATDNDLNRKYEEQGDSDQYLQQQVLLPLGALTHVEVQWTVKLAEYAGQRSSNFMDALSVAQHSLVSKTQSISAKTTSRIIFITDLNSDQCNADDPDDAEFLQQLTPALRDHGITLECHFIPRPDANPEDAARAATARHALQSVVQDVGGKWFEEPASGNMLRAPTTEAVAPSTLSRIELEIGSQVKIPVFIFKATTEAKVPSLKMYNKAAADRGDAPAIQRQSEYVCSDKPELSLAPEQVVSAYPYGKSIVPMDNAERAVIEFKPLPHAEDGSSFKGMQLLGFTDAKTLPLHLNLRSADYVLPIPMKNHPSGLWSSGGTDPTTAARSAVALSSLARALSDSKSVGVVRFALRKNSELHLGVLSPVLDERGNYLSLNVLPFAEDLRMHEFAPLPPDSRFEPSAEACAAAESLIGSMMFGSAAAPPRSFAATGDWTVLHNPTMRRFYEFMKQVAIHGAEVEIPPWDENQLPRALSSPAALAAVEAFNTHAPTTAAEKSKRGARAYGAADQDGDGQEDVKRPRDGSQPVAFAATSRIKINNLTAVADFERELSAVSGQDYEASANVLEVLTNAMVDWASFHTSSDSNLYPLIIDCLRAMRRACINLKLAPTYTHALTRLFEHNQMLGDGGGLWCAQGNVPTFLAAIKAESGLGPITKAELEDAETAMTPEAAAAFMAREPTEALAAQDTDNDEVEHEAYDEDEANM